ncbi:MltA domain-containing protein [Oceanicola sp. D3]|uniref:MltA domain-containing protein n=1 Tax=Oceanicola sp. D3 TaxID=2587163 RepID=UPI0020C81425|nr:MltA domain-containing protein [Oceanicola sp. D3]
MAEDAVMTGYFEPVYEGALQKSDDCRAPIHALPEGWQTGDSFATRAEIEDGDLLEGCELAWLKSPLDAFLLQVQGSGRVRLADGSMRRVGYAGKNGHPYVSLGKLLIERGHLTAKDASMQAIQAWFSENPELGPRYLRENPSYVFFRSLDDLPEELGPIGTAGVPLTAQRSIAVDEAHTRLGALAYVVPKHPDTAPRLCVAQDTGGAIKGAGRTDLFCGTGAQAGAQAGRLNTTLSFFRLVPKAVR